MNTYKDKVYDPADKVSRFKSLILDWLFICAYLLLLFLFILLFYFLFFNEIPEFTNVQSQLIATFTSVIPVVVIFSVMEGRKNYATWGKRKSHLKVVYKDSPC